MIEKRKARLIILLTVSLNSIGACFIVLGLRGYSDRPRAGFVWLECERIRESAVKRLVDYPLYRPQFLRTCNLTSVQLFRPREMIQNNQDKPQ